MASRNMSTPRPNFIDVRSASQASDARPLRSPRLHVPGEAPPELSPLDAFALQSRLLAKQLEESEKQGKRLSRLPPLTVESPVIVQGRSEYFRSMSTEDDADEDPPILENPDLRYRTEVDDDDGSHRPRSMHPRMSHILPPTPDDDPQPVPPPPKTDWEEKGGFTGITGEQEYFFGSEARRERSPSPLDSSSLKEKQSDSGFISQEGASPRYLPPGKTPVKMHSFDSAPGLLPPRTPFPKRSSSFMSSPLESTDGEGISSFGTSLHSQPPRKLSDSGSMTSPGFRSIQRSPSISSEASGLRPSLNFSRPRSRAETPGLEPPTRQASSDSHASFLLQDGNASTPVSMDGERFSDLADDAKSAAPSYIYSKFSLPRGKTLQRGSMILLDNPLQAQSQHQQPPTTPPSNIQAYPVAGQSPPSPPAQPRSSASSPGLMLERTRSNLSADATRSGQQVAPGPSRPSQSHDAPRGRALASPLNGKPEPPPSTATSDSNSTIKAQRSMQSSAPTMNDISAEEHLTKAIALHENGSLKESTYHLRFAARKRHPTGMLLYALACRHGWGMRPNQKEGVEWLRRAADSAQIEIAEEEDQNREGKPVDVVEIKTRKAQFALSIYELGVSHMNGWGIEQDKVLALRCFEIAGAWGDVDALAEAGFCYAQGVGCKKNLKKSAHFYRQAEAKGMSMVGNSWIHKSKYNDDSKDSDTKARSKSRGRKGLFGSKKHAAS